MGCGGCPFLYAKFDGLQRCKITHVSISGRRKSIKRIALELFIKLYGKEDLVEALI